jgi:hypothetical protein
VAQKKIAKKVVVSGKTQPMSADSKRRFIDSLATP